MSSDRRALVPYEVLLLYSYIYVFIVIHAHFIPYDDVLGLMVDLVEQEDLP